LCGSAQTSCPVEYARGEAENHVDAGELATYIFSFFALMMVLQLVWVKTMVPETKGVPLEQIQKQLGTESGDDEL
jgi:hypothetical protein